MAVTVEPAVLLFMFTIYLWYPLFTELMYENINGKQMGGCSDNDTKCQEEQDIAQEYVSRLQLYIAASRHIPAFFSSLLLGPFTDRYGRRPVMILSCIGNGIWTFVLLLNVYIKFSSYYFIIGGVMDGICGGVSTFSFASFAYIADTSNRGQRTKKIAVTESMIFLGGFIASISGGVWADKAGFAPPLFMVLACYITIILYVLLRLKEQRQVSQVPSNLSSYSITEHLRRTSNVLLSPADGRYPLWLNLTTFALLIMAFAGTNNIFILFLYDEPFNWTKSGVAYFLAFNTLLNGLVVLFILPEFNRCLGDYWTTFIGTVSALLGFIVLGLSASDWMLFTGSTIGAFGSMTIPTMRSSMSKMISADSQGSLFSLVSAMEILCVFVSSSVMSMVYEVTHDYYHGFCFLIEAGLTLVTIALLIVHKSLERWSPTFTKRDEDLIVPPTVTEEDEDNPPLYLLSPQEEEIENIIMMSQISIMTNQTAEPITPPPQIPQQMTPTSTPQPAAKPALTCIARPRPIINHGHTDLNNDSDLMSCVDITNDSDLMSCELEQEAQLIRQRTSILTHGHPKNCGHATCTSHSHCSV